MAYALGPMRPDRRHGRIFIRRRPRRAFVVALTLLAVLGASGAFIALYRAMTRPATLAEVPLLRADAQATRHRPDNPGGMEIPGQGTMVLDGDHGGSKAEQLLPPPEAPLPRPATVNDSPPPEAPPATPAAPPVVAAIPPAPVTPPAAQREAPPAPAPAAAAPPPALPAAEGKGYRLQLAAVRSPEAARQEWERLKRLHGDVLGALDYAAQRVDLGERGIFYRIQAGPIADAATAERECGELKRRGVGCILVKP
ncbi:MAG TPA: SPOR domain-containing protein [Stellaceae bacterium]|nr:SPOR domain-containing protein [Stellaceae bacterium]